MLVPSTSIRDAGLGLRSCYYADILEHLPPISWFEALTENYMFSGGKVLERLEQIRTYYPIAFHGVGLSLGSTDPLSQEYLLQLKQLCHRFNPAYVSDHLCWTSLNQHYTHELLPLPYTEETISHVVERIKKVQDFLGQPILIENVSSYFTYAVSNMPEWEFLSTIAERADCLILLDVNNIYVSAKNHNFNPEVYLLNLPRHRIRQIHLGGYEDCGTHLLDTHGASVSEPVWQLYATALQMFGSVPTCIEWDNNVPDFDVVMGEVSKVRKYMKRFSLVDEAFSAKKNKI